MSAIATAALIGFGTKALSRFGGQKAADKMADLVGLQREELKMLNHLQDDMDQLIAEPFRTACRLIEDASRPWRTQSESLLLLDEARSSLTRALVQDADTLRLSLAALLLASIWEIKGSHNDAMVCLQEAWTYAVAASKAVADKDPSPRGRVLGLRLPRRHRRPKSIRVLAIYRVSVFKANLMQLKAFRASAKARKQEQNLLSLHEYVEWLRGTLISWDVPAVDLPQYEPTIVRSYNGGIELMSLVSTLYVSYALSYEPSADGDVTEALLSDSIAPWRFKIGLAFGRDYDDVTIGPGRFRARDQNSPRPEP